VSTPTSDPDPPVCFLTSGDDVFWSEPRACRPLGATTVSGPERSILALQVDPPAIGQRFGRGGDDIGVLAVSPAHEGDSVDPLGELPVEVHLLLPEQPCRGETAELRRENLRHVGRGTLVATREEAEAKDASLQRANGPRV
jgi:hypothetical protein